MMKKTMIGILTLVLSMGLLAGCGGTGSDPSPNGSTGAPAASAKVSGTVRLNGSTSMKKLTEAMTESFNQEYPGVTAQGQFTGSGQGLEALASGSTDIGNSSRALKDEEKTKGLVENIVAIDGIAMILDKNNTVSDLTLEQIAKIYTGEISNWKEIGGADGQIVVIGRESGSGTRGAFEEMLKIEDKCQYAQELDQTGAVMTTVSSTPNAIGYISLDVLNDTVKALKLEGVEPTAENIKAGTYKLSRPFVMATKGEIGDQSEQVKLFFDFINSEKGQEIIKKVGLITVK